MLIAGFCERFFSNLLSIFPTFSKKFHVKLKFFIVTLMYTPPGFLLLIFHLACFISCTILSFPLTCFVFCFQNKLQASVHVSLKTSMHVVNLEFSVYLRGSYCDHTLSVPLLLMLLHPDPSLPSPEQWCSQLVSPPQT